MGGDGFVAGRFYKTHPPRTISHPPDREPWGSRRCGGGAGRGPPGGVAGTGRPPGAQRAAAYAGLMSVRRVMGTEVEYGISVQGMPTANPMVASSQVVNAYA